MTVFQIGSTEIVETKRNGIVRYEFDGKKIYRIRVEGLAGVPTNTYLILDSEATLIDPGFYSQKSRVDLLDGFKTLNSDFAEDITPADVGTIIVTHAHIDHFGMLAHDDFNGKRVYLHPSDEDLAQTYLTGIDDWVCLVQAFCNETGGIVEVDRHTLSLSVNLPPDMWSNYDLVNLHDGDEIINGYQVYHTPGHSPGHSCLRVGPVLLLGDLVWSSASVQQVPECLRPGAGLGNYLASLRKMANLGTTLGLAGHRSLIHPVADRVSVVEAFHRQRLSELVDLCQEDMSLYRLADEYCRRHPKFVGVSSLDEARNQKIKFVCLASIKTHVEYLVKEDRMIVTDSVNGVPMYRSKVAIAS